MKRALLEILALGGVLVLLAGAHREIGQLQSTRFATDIDIGKLESAIRSLNKSVRPDLPSRIEAHDSELIILARSFARVSQDLDRIKADSHEQLTRAQKQAINAISGNTALRTTVESTQRMLHDREKALERFTETVNSKLDETQKRLNSIDSVLLRDIQKMAEEMLLPCVQLSGEETVGSGTVIASLKRKNGSGYDSYVLTAYHVIRNILADNPELARRGIDVIIYTKSGTVTRKCDIKASNPKRDLSLVKLRGTAKIEHVAKLMSKKDLERIKVWAAVYAIGCPLGNDPIPTGGFVSNLKNEVNGSNYWMINAPTYYGNSGGGIYDAKKQELIAVFSKIYTHGSSQTVIPHMGLGVPLSQVYPWLEKEGFAFLVPGDQTMTQVLAAPGK